MKCNQLKSFIVRYNGEFIRAYKETEVDEAIEELKEFAEDACLERDDNQAAIDELNAELESLKATHYTESVDAGMRERKLKHTLLLARAERYKMREFIAREEGNLCNQMSWSQFLRERTYSQWVDQLLRIANLANKLQNKCRAKAEEYK